MGKRKLKAILTGLAFPGLVLGAAVPVPYPARQPVMLSIPSANMLLHGQFRLSGRFQYFNGSEPGSDSSAQADSLPAAENLNYTSELLFGVENRAELGMQYGKALSFSVKALLLREDVFWPDLVFGVRNIFGTQEGTLYGVADNATLRGLREESYLTVAKSFASRSRVHMGMSILTANKGWASLNGGVEQDLGAGAYLGYEFFERFSDFHQVLTFHWSYRRLLGFSLAMTEFQSWIRQDGKWGFFLTPKESLPDGYNSPGVSFSLQFLGWVPHRQKKTLPERVGILEVRNAELEKEVSLLQERVAGVKRTQDSLRASGALIRPGPRPVDTPQAAELLQSLSEKMASDLGDPREIRELMGKIARLGREGGESLKRAAADTAGGELRIAAVLVMAFSRDTAYVTPLRALCVDKDARVRREALTALVKVASRSALEDVRKLLSDPDESVALAAGEAYRQLGNAGKTAGEARGAPAKPPSGKSPPARSGPPKANTSRP